MTPPEQTAASPTTRSKRQRNASTSLTASLPVHRLYIALKGEFLTVLHVRSNDSAGEFFTVQLTQHATRAQDALIAALSVVPFRAQVFIHTLVQPIRDLIRKPSREWPHAVHNVVTTRSLRLRSGSITRLEIFWQDVLLAIAQEDLPDVGTLSNYNLYTYAITDDVQTHSVVLLYGEGLIHMHTDRLKGAQLSLAELSNIAWALNLIPHGKTVEIHTFHPKSKLFWTDYRSYVEEFPEAQTTGAKIGKVIADKSLRFNLPDVWHEDSLTRVVRLAVIRTNA